MVAYQMDWDSIETKSFESNLFQYWKSCQGKGQSEYSLYRVQPINDGRAIIFEEAAAEV